MTTRWRFHCRIKDKTRKDINHHLCIKGTRKGNEQLWQKTAFNRGASHTFSRDNNAIDWNVKKFAYSVLSWTATAVVTTVIAAKTDRGAPPKPTYCENPGHLKCVKKTFVPNRTAYIALLLFKKVKPSQMWSRGYIALKCHNTTQRTTRTSH